MSDKIKVFAATKEGQGARKSDFFYAKEGELVLYPFECDRDKNLIDGGCGCRRAMAGFQSGKGTTTFKVAEVAMTEQEYIKKFLDAQRKAGWIKTDADVLMWEREGRRLLEFAADFPAGTLLEKRGSQIKVRQAV